MVLHSNFTLSPYEILKPEVRGLPAAEELRKPLREAAYRPAGEVRNRSRFGVAQIYAGDSLNSSSFE
jgi:hypothetical protein